MRSLLLAVLVLFTSFSLFADEHPGHQSADQWLQIIDVGHYSQSWETTGKLFKSQVSMQQWDEALKQVRAPLGKLISRNQTTVETFTSLPGAPDGEYLVITYSTVFENMRSATETVTMSKDGDTWGAVGYFIQ